jgi:hypothetical protein
MKKINIYLFLAGLIFTLASCYDRDFDVMAPQLATVSDLKYTLDGDSARLSWVNPAGKDSLTAVIKTANGDINLQYNKTAFAFGIIETNKDYTITLKMKDTKGNLSLGQTIHFKRDGANPVMNAKAEQVDSKVVLTWTLPSTTINGISLKYGTQSISLPANATKYEIDNLPVGKYLFSIITTDAQNKNSNTVYVDCRVGPTAVAVVGVAANVQSIADDDEKAMAEWILANYPSAKYISFAEIKNGTADLSQYRVISWYYDNVDGFALPAIATDAAVVSKMAQYHKNGGNLLLSTYALQYLWTIGRMTIPYFTEFGTGGGFDDGGTWWVNINIMGKHDNSTHPVFAGISTETWEGNRKVWQALGPGWKENHNAVLVRIPEYYKLNNDDEQAYTKFCEDNNARWLATWDGIRDYWMCGIMELMPKDDFQGTAIQVGLGPIEFNQNTGNQYQASINKFYKNTIDYLKTR